MPNPKTLLPHIEDHTQQRMVERANSDDRHQREVPLLDGRAYPSIAVAAASTVRVGHGLGYVPRGYIVTKCDTPGPGTLYYSASTANDITIGNSHATSALTFSIWLY